MKVAVASGKGGTGKSTVSTNLAYLLSKRYKDVALVDCDVEEPNCHIFFDFHPDKTLGSLVSVPEADVSKCIGCGDCVTMCQFNALAVILDKVLIFPELCHSCTGCWLICPTGSLSPIKREIGRMEQGKVGELSFVQGTLNIGEPMAVPLIKETKKFAGSHDITILDCPPGTSCPVINAVDDADYVLLVTEPTPFGLHDLSLAVGVVRKLNKKFGIIINRANENDSLIENYAKAEKIEVVAKIQEDKRIAECYSQGKLAVKEHPEYEEAFEPLIKLFGGKQ